MKRKISILSLIFFVVNLMTPFNIVNATEITNENDSAIINEYEDNDSDDSIIYEDSLEEIQENEELIKEEINSEEKVNSEEVEVYSEDKQKEDNTEADLTNNKYDKEYISFPLEYRAKSEENFDKVEQFLSEEDIVDNYLTLKNKTNDNYEIALAYSDGSYYFVDSANSYDEAMGILESTIMPISEDTIIPVIVNKSGQVIYATSGIAYILNVANSNINIYTSSSLSSAYTYANQAYVRDVPLIESTETAAKIQVAGYIGWVRNNYNNSELSDIQIIPMNQATNPSYYIVEKGILYHYTSSDLTVAANSKGYKYAISVAPSYLKENTSYFSYDGNYFYDGSNIENGLNTLVNDLKAGNKNNAVNKNSAYYSYYQYLPFRSKTMYTAQDLDNYINAKTDSNSKLRGIGQALKDAEEKYGVNALLTLGVAINESGWGKSTISQQKNNLFGIKAYDSNVNQATTFDTPGDSVIEFAKNYISRGYTNPKDWRYFGGFLGNKNLGANVKYASDPYWGEKAARYAFDTDLYLSSNNLNSLKDNNRYKIGIYTANNEVRNSLGSTLYSVSSSQRNLGASFIITNNNTVSINGEQMYEIYADRHTLLTDTSYEGDYNWNSKGYIKTSGIQIVSDGSNSSTVIPEKPTGITGIAYTTHIQDIGWQSWKSNGETAGTQGQSKRLEAIKITLENYPGATVKYSTHVQDVGWQSWKSNGELAGTENQSKRLEAIKIEVTGLPDNLEIEYRVHVQNEGWQNWVSSGVVAGTVGKGLRLEGIEIRVVEKASVKYKSHIQNIGWESFKSDGVTSGTVGKSLRLEGIAIEAENLPEGASIRYKTHIQNIGWESQWKTSGSIAGTSGQSLRLEAIKIELVGAPGYHVEYRTHIQDLGWQSWKKDGQVSGTEGKSKRLEGIEIRIVRD